MDKCYANTETCAGRLTRSNRIEQAAYRITRIANDQQWFTRFEAKLKSLPAEQREHSALNILGAYASPVGSAKSVQADADKSARLL